MTADSLERLQRLTPKVIFGFDTPYNEGLEKSGLMTLATRKKKRLSSSRGRFSTQTGSSHDGSRIKRLQIMDSEES